MVKLIQDEGGGGAKRSGEAEESYGTALSKRLEKIQFKTLKPLVWKSLTQERFMVDLSQMGLSSFFKSKFGQGDESLCREFLCSYKKHGSGIVKQQIVQTDPRVVEVVLKLPHNGKLVKEVPKLTPPELYSLYNGPTVKVKHNGYSVKALCDPHFKEFVSFLVDRMSCKVNCTYVSAEILYAAKHVWETKCVLDWAGYMSHRIQAQCEKVRGTSQSAFEYTQYLTQIIQHQLGIAQAEDAEARQPMLVDGAMGLGGFPSTSSRNDVLPVPAANGDSEDSGVHEKDLAKRLKAGHGEQAGECSKSQHFASNGQQLDKQMLKRSAEPRHSKKPKAEKVVVLQEGPDYAVSLLAKVTSWIKGQAGEQEQQKNALEERLNSADRRVMELQAEVNETKARCESEHQRQVQWEVQYNLVQQEKLVLQDQVQSLIGQQQALRQRLELCEREKARMSEVAQAYFARAMNGKEATKL